MVRAARTRSVEQARVLLPLAQRLGLHRGQEHAGVGQPVEAAVDGRTGSGQVQRRADGRHRAGDGARAVAGFGGPAHQGVAAQRHAGSQQRRGHARAQPAQDPADLLEVTRVVGARGVVQFARAAAEVRQRDRPAALRRFGREALRVVAGRRAFQAVEQHQGRGGGARLQRQVDVDEVAVRRGPAFALQHRHAGSRAA
jgi:hypothetical protein